MSKLWASLVGSLASLAATFLFVHAWVLSDYLIYPSSHRDIFPSRAQLPDYYKYTVGPYLQKKGLEAEPLTFQTQDDPSNSFRGSSVAAWLVRSSRHMAGTGISRGGVVLVHDAGADNRQMLPLVKLWHSYEYDCLLLQTSEAGDARTYLGLAAQYDVLAAIDVLKEKTGAPRIVTMGVGEGAAAALFAAQKDFKVDAVVASSMHAETDALMLSRASELVKDLKGLDPEKLTEHPVLKLLVSSQLMFIDEEWVTSTVTALSSHMAVIRSSDWLTWLHGHTDPLKGIHRLQPRGLFLIQSKSEFGRSTLPIQKLYHRAGQCEPKQAHLPEESASPVALSRDGKFNGGLGAFLEKLD